MLSGITNDVPLPLRHVSSDNSDNTILLRDTIAWHDEPSYHLCTLLFSHLMHAAITSHVKLSMVELLAGYEVDQESFCFGDRVFRKTLRTYDYHWVSCSVLYCRILI
ncbi:hypothetical protein Hypma_001665 [Hypsizygus marmoreus]|uniref:Uncharacterized protein n=1 Tax=Hypsizygus marmoreus TaxID=39966 RepID=A0A369JA44_HYPMA|nr:hypothetical protein Hypma_001665 [Hypsizygus marmoreus]